jgi:hypothetical protein
MSGTREKDGRSAWSRRYLEGLDNAARGNAQAFGFSILITVTFGVVSNERGQPGLGELVGFALASVAAFAGVNLLAALLLTRAPRGDPPTRIVLLATATDFLAVGAGVGAAAGVAALAPGWAAWLLAPALASLVYALVQAFEFALGRAASSDGPDRPRNGSSSRA